MMLPVSGQTWRSALYPDNWKPGLTDLEGRFLHDFSYAGYQGGLVSLPEINTNIVDITKSPYFADNTGSNNVRDIIQKALEDVGKAGGGVVFLPQGTYKVNISTAAANGLRVAFSNVVLRGAGTDKTFIYNENSNVRNTSLITVRPTTGGDWLSSGTNTVTISNDLLQPTDTIPVSSVSGFKVGDWIVIRSNVTTDFILEHQMTQMWGTAMTGPVFYRTIVAIDAVAKTLKLDAPTRYYLKTRDNARVYKVNPVLSEVGIENFSIANKQTTISGLGGLDFGVAGTGAYEIHNSHIIQIHSAINSWVKNVNTYKPTQNTGDFHLVSNGIVINRSRFVTVESCFFQKPQYEGEGGNGYMFTLGGNDCLVKNCHANHARHNYDFKTMQSNGNVILRSRGENSSLASDFHMHLSMANLFDNFTANKDMAEAKFRPWGTAPAMHGYPTTQSVFWNTNGEAYMSGKTYIVDSQQFGWGYVIGTRGAANAVRTAPYIGTVSGYNYDSSPEDFKEGVGNGNNLQPQSLYEDQLAKRKERNSVSSIVHSKADNAERIHIYPNPTNIGVVNIKSVNQIDSYRLINAVGRVVAKKNEIFSNQFEISIPQKGLYILELVASYKTFNQRILVN